MAPIFTPGDSLGSEEMTGELHRPITVTVSDEPTSADGRSWSYIIEWTEDLTWHRDHLGESFANPDDDTLEAMNTLIGEELSSLNAPGTLIDEVQVDVGPNYQHNPDEEALIVSTTVFLPEDARLGDLQNAAWPFIAAMINVTDPGTFGSRYIMSALTERCDVLGEWRPATSSERFDYLSGHKMPHVLETRETEHGLEVRA